MLQAISQRFCLVCLLGVLSQTCLAQSKPPEKTPTLPPVPMARETAQAPPLAPRDHTTERPSILVNLFIFSVTDNSPSKKPREIANSIVRFYAKALVNDKSKSEQSDFQVDLMKSLDKDPTHGFQILSRPCMMLVAEKPGVLRVENEATMQYMVPTKDGMYELKKTEPLKLGMEVSLKAEEPQTEVIQGKETKTVVLKRLFFSLSTLDGRMEYPGVDLPIGHPKVSTRSLETGLNLKEKVPMLVELPSDESPCVFLLIWFEIPELD